MTVPLDDYPAPHELGTCTSLAYFKVLVIGIPGMQGQDRVGYSVLDCAHMCVHNLPVVVQMSFPLQVYIVQVNA